MSNFCFNFLTQILYCVVFGITGGATVGMRAVVLIELIGLSKFVLGYGILLFFGGIGLLVGPPIIGNKHVYSNITKNYSISLSLGALYETTGNHESGFYFAGALLLTSGMLVFPLIIVKHLSSQEGDLEEANNSNVTNNLLKSTLIIQSMIVLSPSRCQRQNSKTATTRF